MCGIECSSFAAYITGVVICKPQYRHRLNIFAPHRTQDPPGVAAADGSVVVAAEPNFRPDSDDNLFREFRRICERLAGESSYLGKTAILHKFFLKASEQTIPHSTHKHKHHPHFTHTARMHVNYCVHTQTSRTCVWSDAKL